MPCIDCKKQPPAPPVSRKPWTPRPPTPQPNSARETFLDFIRCRQSGEGRARRPGTSPNGTPFVFVHVPKTGGITVSKLIGRSPMHVPVRRIKADDQVFTFAVVRDPWERLLSAFSYLKARNRVMAFPSYPAPSVTAFADAERAISSCKGDFRAFVRDFGKHPDKYIGLVHLKPQVYWLRDDSGKIAVTKLCRHERFDEEVKPVLESLGYEWRKLRLNRSRHPLVGEAYDEETADIVGAIYKEDVETFGYSRPKAPGLIRPRWIHPCAVETPCVLTACDAEFFPGLMLLSSSIRRLSADTPIVCVDLGLTEEQRRRAASLGVTIQSRPATPIDEFWDGIVPWKREWYVKPWHFDALGPYRRAIWMDCDVVVLRDLDKLLGFLDDGPVFAMHHQEHDCYARNEPGLYERFPVPDPEEAAPTPNAGIVGFDLDRDWQLMCAWRSMCARGASDPGGVDKLIRLADQGALWWAIQKCGLAHRVLCDGMRWNFPPYSPDGGPLRQSERYRMRGYLRGDLGAVITAAATDYPNAATLHFGGKPKPWEDQPQPPPDAARIAAVRPICQNCPGGNFVAFQQRTNGDEAVQCWAVTPCCGDGKYGEVSLLRGKCPEKHW